MKKTQLTDALRTIRKRFVSFLSIVFIIMLGTGGFFMARFTARGLSKSATRFFGSQNFLDYALTSSIGVTDDDLERVRQIEGVSQAEGVMTLSGSMYVNTLNLNVQLLSWTETISVPEIKQGTKPVNANECAIGEDLANRYALSIGDVLTLESPAVFNVNPLTSDTYTVTAIVDHPDYARSDLNWLVILPLSGFNTEALENRYTQVFLTADSSDFNQMFSASYESSIQPVTDRLKQLLPQLEESSADDARRIANAKIDAEWAKAEEQIADAEAQIAAGEAELDAQLASAKAQLAAAKAQLAAARTALETGEAQLRNAEEMLRRMKEIEALINGNPDSINDFINQLLALMDAYDYAGTPEEKEAARQALVDFVKFDENGATITVITDITGIDVYRMAEDPAAYASAREVLRLSKTVLLLSEALTQDFLPQDVLNAISNIEHELDRLEHSSDEEIRAAARLHLQQYLEQPLYQAVIGLAQKYLGLDIEWLYHIIYTPDTVDEEFIASTENLRIQFKRLSNSILNVESLIAEGRSKLATGWSSYYSALQLVQQKEAEMNAKEADARTQIADAKRQLNEKIEEGKKQLEEARKQADSVTCNWVLQERTVNPGFLDVSGNIASAQNMGYAFGSLFLIVAALVCFSTLVIIIEEEKKLVGTTKAFGFTNREILAKYMIFSLSASVLGSLLGIGFGSAVALFVENMLEQSILYVFSISGLEIDFPVTAIVCLGAVALCAGVTVFACSSLLKSSAYNLMNGITVARNLNKKAKKTSGNKTGSLYSRLVIRNMLDEKARVLISMVITGAGCCIVGVGVTMKFSFDAMMRRQINDVTVYDYRVDYDPSKISEEELKELETEMDQQGIQYIKASYMPYLFESDEKLSGLYLLVCDDARLQDYVRITQYGSNSALEIPDSGILIPYRMKESYGINKDETLMLYNSSLEDGTADVIEYINCYLGRMCVCSASAYQEIFQKEAVDNCYYVLLGGTNRTVFETMLSDTSGGFTAESNDYFLDSLEGTIKLYNVIVLIAIFIAVIMSFIILTNLANIFLNRKKKELIVMRINGFSIRETINYLVKETVVTGVTGLVFGVLGGLVICPVVIRIIEPEDCIFGRGTNWLAWLIAVLVEGAFLIVINGSVFRKVRKLDFHDIM